MAAVGGSAVWLKIGTAAPVPIGDIRHRGSVAIEILKPQTSTTRQPSLAALDRRVCPRFHAVTRVSDRCGTGALTLPREAL